MEKSRVRRQSNPTVLSLAVWQLRGWWQASVRCFSAASLKETARCRPYNHSAGVRVHSKNANSVLWKCRFAIQNVLPSVSRQFSTLDWLDSHSKHTVFNGTF